jgi:endonuclease YncB( thermonuclease family)
MTLIARAAALFTSLMSAGAAFACPAWHGLPPVAAQASGGAELRLADGRTARLAGVVVPEATTVDARRFLDGLIAGRPVAVGPLRPEPDRWGRMLVRARVAEASLEDGLVRAGLALVSLAPGEADCADALLAAERAARRAGAGLWSGAGPALPSDDLERAAGLAGRFVLVEGRVFSVNSRDYATFINFGRRWTEHVSVMIRRADRRAVEDRLGALAGLRGRRVLVRGVLEVGRAPRLGVTRPEQIEVLDEGP